MFLFTLTLGLLFIPKADTLTCHECVRDGFSNGCTEQGTAACSTQNHHCIAGRVYTFYDFGVLANIPYRGCSLPEECFEGTLNFGHTKGVLNSTCCSTELCNNQYPDAVYNAIPNGKKCFTCDSHTCNKTLTCNGDEDYCAESKVGDSGPSSTLKGCVSKVLCSDKSILLVEQLTGLKISCCQGDFCNSANSGSPIVLLLLVPLLSSISI
ncbi:urokinase plasminogen activator surface receptor-like isoform X1 [Cyprinodon tularosa]|uniref:urokinase plasminogen activator surface receptor-like isoform X1 n=1 Tax=Cyprinodon tularosa TaxID=77115 RepID=UPI0018E264FE|nr:urokinase plasminogen activator surface receptor-like isoform X1 [Cyprinodon tularosa]